MMEMLTVNARGGKQHAVEHRCEALFPRSILAVARLRHEGYTRHSYEDDNYLAISCEEHVGRALRHLLLWQAGVAEDGSVDEHLVHACCRLMMALEMRLIQGETDRAAREPLVHVYGQEIE